jgi:hypothetical protein
VHSDALTNGLPSAKKWLGLDLEAAAGKQGVDVAQLQSLCGGGDPTQFLTYLAKAGDVHKVGSEDVNGAPTTHYHATVDIGKLAGSAGKAADSVRRLERISGLKKLPTDIWIDASQRVRRRTVAIDARPTAADLVLAADRLQALRGAGRRAGATGRPDRRLQRRRRRLSAGAPRSPGGGPLGHPKLG